MRMKRWKAVMHFNKPGSKAANPTPWTVHWRGTCYAVKQIECQVPMVSEWKPEKKDNPRAFFTARVAEIRIDRSGVATLV